MNSFPQPFRALVIGATGAIGAAFVRALQADPDCTCVEALHRGSQPAINFADEDSIAAAARVLAGSAPFHLIINAAGLLHSSRFMPEKKLADLNYQQMQETFLVNTFGPAMVMRHFSGLLDRERSMMAVISAKVGSIEDNRLGGWYSYRASKAALNMFLKTAALEMKRSNPQAVMIALHPGTVSSPLSRPFRGDETGRAAQDAVRDMLALMSTLSRADSGKFFSYNGEALPW